jgi:signal transduction histidine kinase
VLPYAPVVGVGVLFASRVFGGADLAEGALPWGLLVVILAVVGRSIAATREGRRIMALERDQLLASLSHDLRTPLTAVTGFADVLYDSWVELRGTERLEMVDIIRAEAAALSDIVGDLAALARHELEAVPLQMERVEGKRLVAEAIRLVFDVTAPIPVKAEVEPYLELVGDRRRLVQVLRALLENAQRYGRGRILVVVRRDEGGRIIEVHDDGDGVDPRRVRSIWQRFERGENNLNAGVPGSGLGLAVVRGLARAHGGDAGYRRSDRLGGACFYVEIPYDRAALGEE